MFLSRAHLHMTVINTFHFRYLGKHLARSLNVPRLKMCFRLKKKIFLKFSAPHTHAACARLSLEEKAKNFSLLISFELHLNGDRQRNQFVFVVVGR